MIRFGIRQSFNTLDQFAPRYRECQIPIELALPYRMTDYELIHPHLTELAGLLLQWRTPILSLHAPQGRLAEPGFRIWAEEVGRFASLLGVHEITVHPSRFQKDRPAHEIQHRVLQICREIEAAYSVSFCLETFMGGKRLFSVDDIMRLERPMTLDVAHLHDTEVVWRIVHQYHPHISTVHLSGKGGDRTHHLPIDDECLQVVEALIGYGWQGNVILEYLPDYHDRLEEDFQLLQQRFCGTTTA
jgi:sugar phosphate isomerase/epimerase